ncbi:hypothetical protein DUI87_15564 [Hirundo rustica rustica]|uniref:Uncharacterized protein n=1 Tax=Hirundo rustica rustica TaxID=333673 RepID=A0A3M0K4F5_HIRRU|nr:hypothetical protein DUI87_15564 [Hirundo rustica rustica]
MLLPHLLLREVWECEERQGRGEAPKRNRDGQIDRVDEFLGCIYGIVGRNLRGDSVPVPPERADESNSRVKERINVSESHRNLSVLDQPYQAEKRP